MTTEGIINKVSDSGLITLDLAKFLPKEVQKKTFDLKDYLFRGMILKEKDYRAALTSHDWEQYRDTYVGVYCSADAVIPLWAYMLVSSYLEAIAKDVVFGNEDAIDMLIARKALGGINPEDYQDKRVVVKGCGDASIPASAYLEITNILKPYARSIMYGEPCSTVPVFKRKRG